MSLNPLYLNPLDLHLETRALLTLCYPFHHQGRNRPGASKSFGSKAHLTLCMTETDEGAGVPMRSTNSENSSLAERIINGWDRCPRAWRSWERRDGSECVRSSLFSKSALMTRSCTPLAAAGNSAATARQQPHMTKTAQDFKNAFSHTNSAGCESGWTVALRDLTHACAMSFSLMRVSSSSQPIIEGWVVCDP